MSNGIISPVDTVLYKSYDTSNNYKYLLMYDTVRIDTAHWDSVAVLIKSFQYMYHMESDIDSIQLMLQQLRKYFDLIEENTIHSPILIKPNKDGKL